MTHLTLRALACAVAPPVHAQDMTLSEALVLPRLIDSACFDLVEDSNGCEQVLLLASDGDVDRADLVILRDWRTDPASEPLLISRGIAFNGAMWGMAPSRSPADDGRDLMMAVQSCGDRVDL